MRRSVWEDGGVTDAAGELALLERALDQAGTLIAAARPDQAGLPTPCRSWDLRTLVNHVVDEVRQFALVTGGGRRRPPEPDAIGEDWAAAYRAAADELRAAWRRPGALDREITLPMGSVPAVWTVDQQLTELAVHAWDVARATGQSTDLKPDVARRALDWGRENLLPQYRGAEESGSHIGPEVPLAPDAPLYDRLAAFGGRDPRRR
jgi:uncharacterized protein (TIGR03086 family)